MLNKICHKNKAISLVGTVELKFLMHKKNGAEAPFFNLKTKLFNA
jgi:hypothetical protein